MIIQCKKGDYKEYRKITESKPEGENRHLTRKERHQNKEAFENREFDANILEKQRIRKKE